MKFQKGLLTEEEQREAAGIKIAKGVKLKPLAPASAPAAPRAIATSPEQPSMAKDRLFETQEKVTSGSRRYLGVLAVVGVVVLIVGGVVFYAMQPGVGDRVLSPRGAEDAVREHFLTKEKRTATDIVFFKCDGSYWARVGVETRTDMPNPLMKVGTFKAKVTGEGEGSWQVSETAPITSPDLDVPCK